MKRSILKTVLTHYKNPKFNVERLARESHISTRHLYEMCQKHFRMNPKDLIECFRIETAASILQASPEPLVRVAEASGFSETRALNRALKRYFGKTSCRCKILFKENPKMKFPVHGLRESPTNKNVTTHNGRKKAKLINRN
jgi:transcriptional regulator GlxA family with amidase domain